MKAFGEEESAERDHEAMFPEWAGIKRFDRLTGGLMSIRSWMLKWKFCESARSRFALQKEYRVHRVGCGQSKDEKVNGRTRPH
jgi:hypothetical protein